MSDVGSKIDAAAALIREGGVVLYPTRTLWGIGGDARVHGVVERIQELKGRDSTSPFLVLVQNLMTVRDLTACLPSTALKLMAALWPGELTLLLPASDEAPSALVGPAGFIGLRIATHPVPYALLELTSAWLISTSANRAGEDAPLDLDQISPAIRVGVDAELDYPPRPEGKQSSVVSVNKDGEARLVREGAIARQIIESVLGGELYG